jgi:hypothetical protein
MQKLVGLPAKTSLSKTTLDCKVSKTKKHVKIKRQPKLIQSHLLHGEMIAGQEMVSE